MANTPNCPNLGHVLVTGGCGFLGHHVVRMILLNHPESKVSVLDLSTTRNRIESPKVSYHDGDLTKADFLKELLKKLKPAVVIHTASPHFDLAKEILYAVNVTGTKLLLEASQEAGVKAFVYTSSSSVIMPKSLTVVNGDEKWPYMIGKESPEYYSETKVCTNAQNAQNA
jgi:sterol-4alpha-carboxylate 3-dehydrogenase (decarboxylating)